MSKNELKKKSGANSAIGILFNDIDVITKALYEDKPLSKSSISTSSSRSKSTLTPHFPETKSKPKVNSTEDRFLKDKKSIWSWKALKPFTNARNKRFDCRFSLQVHSIEGLPPSFDSLRLCVKWRRRDGELTTHPVKVSQGLAEFEEQLTNACSIHGTSSGPHHSAKYDAKHSLVYASVFEESEFDLGKHKVDLSRLLPLTLEELEEEKSIGVWTTSYRLSGKAKGATMNVSFGYSVAGNRSSDATSKPPRRFSGQTDGQRGMDRGESLPVISHAFSSSLDDIKDLHEILPISKSELSESVEVLCKKINGKLDYEPQCDVQTVPLEGEFSVVDKGIELPTKEAIKPEQRSIKACEEKESLNLERSESLNLERSESLNLERSERLNLERSESLNLVRSESLNLERSESLNLERSESQKKDPTVVESHTQEQDFGDEESLMKELESAMNNVMGMVEEDENVEFRREESQNLEQQSHLKLKSGYKETRRSKSLDLDYDTEVVASDFLNMLGIEHSPFRSSSESEPESPRERLLRQFEKDTLADGSSLFNFNLGDDNETGFECDGDANSPTMWGPISETRDSSSILHASERTLKSEIQETQNKTQASVLEDMETEALMHEWGLNERAFQRSPSNASGGLGSPIDLPPVDPDPLELPPLGEGLGPMVRTRTGGFLRSMDPGIFRNAKTGGSLTMQVSSPVVVPAEMGSGVMEILQCLASVGIEKLSVQANKVMPLEDISGKTMQQIAWEASERQPSPPQEQIEHGRGSKKYEPLSMDQEYVSLDDLAPLAMNKIEALSIEGLRIQSGLSDKDAPSNISPQFIGEISALEGKRVNSNGPLGLEGTGGLQLMDIKEKDDGDVDGLMGLSVTLDEWMRLDSGETDDGDEISERTSRILAAHHARPRGKASRKGGLLGNNFTVALMVQLRDPLRNFEPVGTPMLGLIQVERVFVPPKPKIHRTLCPLRKTPEDDIDGEAKEEEEKVPEEGSGVVPRFKITEAHVAGLTAAEPNKKTFWGSNTKQQQAGSRWLLANGMGKKNAKHPLTKSKFAAAAKKSSGSDGLWSVSSKGKAGAAVRNPNVIVANETVKLLSGARFV